jgi:predicted AlkP superfamily pyrophosphatase or phosphodiesterase
VHPRFSLVRRLLACLLLPIVICGGPVADCAEPGAAGPARPLILVSIDGYRADYLDRGHSPVLAALAADGVRAIGMRPVFPSLTYPNHYTLATGLYPDQHGVVNNTMHDPVLGNFSPSNRAANTDGRWWDRAEPIWVTAQKQGLRTASVFYPGTQAEIRGVRPAYWQLFDSSVPPDDRVDQVLTWLDLPPDQRPRFVSLYFEQVDVAGHSYGPDSLQVDEAMVTVDAALGRLVAGLRQRTRCWASMVMTTTSRRCGHCLSGTALRWSYPGTVTTPPTRVIALAGRSAARQTSVDDWHGPVRIDGDGKSVG